LTINPLIEGLLHPVSHLSGHTRRRIARLQGQAAQEKAHSPGDDQETDRHADPVKDIFHQYMLFPTSSAGPRQRYSFT
jgi:hypothetical protein